MFDALSSALKPINKYTNIRTITSATDAGGGGGSDGEAVNSRFYSCTLMCAVSTPGTSAFTSAKASRDNWRQASRDGWRLHKWWFREGAPPPTGLPYMNCVGVGQAAADQKTTTEKPAVSKAAETTGQVTDMVAMSLR